MLPLLAAVSLCAPLRAAPVELAPIPEPVTRLVVEAPPNARGWAMLSDVQEAAIKQALEQAGPSARLIRSDGPSGIFESRSFIEAAPAAAAQLKAALVPAGLQVAALHEALGAFHQAAPAQLPQDDAALKAYADRMMDGARPLTARAADFGAFVSALSADPKALSSRSEETRREVARALYNAAVPLADAFNAVRGDQRYQARVAWNAVHPGVYGIDRELYVHAEVHKPAARAPVEPIRELVKKLGRALQAVRADSSTPLLLELLPHADHAVQEDLARRPNAARRLAKDYLAMLEKSILQTRDLALELATRPEGGKQDDIRLPTHSGGVASMDVPKVDAHRAAVWAYRVSDWFFDLGDMPHTIIALLGASPEAADELKAGLPALIARAGPLIAETNAALRSREEARINKQFDSMAGKFLEDPALEPQMDKLRREHVDRELGQWEKYNTVEGHEVLDRAVRTLGWYGPFDNLKPGFDEDAYITNVAAILREATATAGLGMFKLVAQCSLRFVEEVRRHAWPRLTGDAKDAVDGLERDVRARAHTSDLKLIP